MDSQGPNQLEEQHLLDVHEAASLLDISEEELWGLVRGHQVPTHNIAGSFLRFRRKDIEELKNKWRIQRELFPEKNHYFPHQDTVRRATLMENLRDFWYFNDFYILSSIMIVVLIYFIISSQ